MAIRYCCDIMKEQAETPELCGRDAMEELGCPDKLIRRWKDGTFGIVIHDGGSAVSVIKYCPWCGTNIAMPD